MLNALNLCGYSPQENMVRDPKTLTRKEARREYDRWMELKAYRIQQLSCLLFKNGIEIDSSDEKIQRLNEWYITNVTEKIGRRRDEKWPLSELWYSISDDIAAYLGDVIIERQPHLYWELFIPRTKRDISYQQIVIAGYKSDQDGLINYSICSCPRDVVVAVGHNAVNHNAQTVQQRFVHLLHVSSTLDGYPCT